MAKRRLRATSDRERKPTVAAKRADSTRSGSSLTTSHPDVTAAAPAGNRAVGRIVQTKLTVGPVGDRYEQEADRVADRVVGSLDTPVQRQDMEEEELMMSRVQRQPEEEELQMSRAQRQDEEEELQGKEASPSPGPVVGAEGGSLDGHTEQRLRSAQGGGRPIESAIRGSLESSLGADFSKVRIHTGSESDSLNRSLGAKAFTSGNEIFFRSGEYRPGQRSGQETLAHELTHVIQQRRGIQRQTAIQRADDLDDDDDIQWVTNPLATQWTANPLYDESKAKPAGPAAPAKKEGWFSRKKKGFKRTMKRTFGADFSAKNKRAEAMDPAEMQRIGQKISAGQALEQKLVANGMDADEAYDQAFKGVPAEFRPARRTAAEKAVRKNERFITQGNVEKMQEQKAAARAAATSKRLTAKGWSTPNPTKNTAASIGKHAATAGGLAGNVAKRGKKAGSVGEKGQKVPFFGEVIGKDAKMESEGKKTAAVAGGVQQVLVIASSIAKIKDASGRARSDNPAVREQGMDDLQAAVINLGQSAQSANSGVHSILEQYAGGAGATPGMAIVANAQTLLTQIPKLVDLSYRVHQERKALAKAEKSAKDAALVLSLGRVLSRNVQLLAHHVVAMAATITKLVASILEVTPAAVAGTATKTAAEIGAQANKASKALIDSYRAGKTQEARGKWRGTHAEGSAEKLLAADAQQAIHHIVIEAKEGNEIAVRVMGGYGIMPKDLGKTSERDLSELLMNKLEEKENPRTITQKIQGVYQSVKNFPSNLKQKHKDVKALSSVKNELGYGGKTDRGRGWYAKQMLFGKTGRQRAKVVEDITISKETGKTTMGEDFSAEDAERLNKVLYGHKEETGGPEISGPLDEEQMKALGGTAAGVRDGEEELAKR